jgi:catechol 2,3-dioxygenase-like lactoylglutathione lyase family enzyme
MFTHIRLGTNDVGKAKTFYDNALGALGIAGQDMGGNAAYGTFGQGMLMVGPPREGTATHANGGTIGFQASSTEAVDKFHAAGLANGGSDEGAPGVRAGYGIYAAYLRDPDGNKICAITPAP